MVLSHCTRTMTIESSRDSEKQDGLVDIHLCRSVFHCVLVQGERTGQILDLEEKRDTQGGMIGSETKAGAE